MASLRTRTRKDGSVYHAVLYRHGGAQASRSFEDAAKADRWRRLLDQVGPAKALELLDARGGTPDVPSLDEWFTHYLEHTSGITAGSRAEYRRVAQRSWLPRLGELPVDAITRDAVRAWVRHQAATVTRRGTATSAKTIANQHGLLSAVLAEAVDVGHLDGNPCRGVKLPAGQHEEMVVLTDSELAKVIEAVPEYWRPLVAFLAGTGVRWGEATALRWRDLDLQARPVTARITQAWKKGETTRELGTPKSKKSRRTVTVPGRVADLLRARPHGARDGLVFVGPQDGGVHHQAFHPRVWLPAVEKAGIGKRPRIHDLRHTAASHMLAAGVPITDVQRQLGHESITTTVDTYGHLMPGTRERTADALDAALALALPNVEDPPAAIGS